MSEGGREGGAGGGRGEPGGVRHPRAVRYPPRLGLSAPRSGLRQPLRPHRRWRRRPVGGGWCFRGPPVGGLGGGSSPCAGPGRGAKGKPFPIAAHGGLLPRRAGSAAAGGALKASYP